MDFGAVSGFFTSLPTDWIILAAIAAVFILDALRVGTGRIASVGISLTLAVPFSAALSKAWFLGSLSSQLSTPVLQAALFAITFVVIFLLMRRIFIDYGEMGGQPVQALFGTVAATALVVLAWVQVPALESIWHFGPSVTNIFGEAYRFWWLLGTFAALAFAKS